MASKDDFVVVSKKELAVLQRKIINAGAALDDANDTINELTASGGKVRKPRAPKAEAPVTSPLPLTNEAQQGDREEAPAQATKPVKKVAPKTTVTPIKSVVGKKGFAPAMPGKKAG